MIAVKPCSPAPAEDLTGAMASGAEGGVPLGGEPEPYKDPEEIVQKGMLEASGAHFFVEK